MTQPSARLRARDLGIPFDGTPGPLNAITDVPGVEVGHVTLISGEGQHQVGRGPVRTGVSAVLPLGRAGVGRACAAGWWSLNGNGEMTGTHWITESGGLSSPVMITTTDCVGPVHRGVIDWINAHRPDLALDWVLPVVAETWDGYLNDATGGHVRAEHAVAAIEAAAGGPVPEGSVGGGTGMNCYGFKGGVGTASRRVPGPAGDRTATEHTLAAYVQANFGDRHELRIAGVRLGDLPVPNPIDDPEWLRRDAARAGVALPGNASAAPPGGAGSVIVLIATDAPLLPTQCAALARRVPLGLARTGTTGSHFSGDIFLAWSTAGAGQLDSALAVAAPAAGRSLTFMPWPAMDQLYAATVQAVEEAVVNALVAADDMTGRDANTSYAMPHDLVVARLRAAGL